MNRWSAPFALALITACGSPEPPAPASAKPTTGAPGAVIRFHDATAEAGIAFRHENGAFGKKWLPETMGAGLAWLDYDGDGRPDLYAVNGRSFEGHPKKGPFHPALYRNRGDGTFEDVAAGAGLAVEIYGMGVAVGDVDNDGKPDLFVNALGPDRLFRNRGDGTFEDITARAGISDPGYGSSATFLDYDRDGDLDLFACNYVTWSPEKDLYCTLDGTHKSYCTPESYSGATNRLWRNRGDGTFEDVTKAAGVWNEAGKSLGVVAFDHDGDGWTDLAVANDTQPNYLYRNQNGTFIEIGSRVGIAFSEAGAARAGMGIDAADYDGSGRESVVITNFANEMIGLYHNEGKDLYVDDAAPSGIGAPSLLTLGFGAFFFDADLDGEVDLFVANGHVEPDIQSVQKSVSYAQPPHLFRNRGDGRFDLVRPSEGDPLARAMVGRGAATADYDGDGDLDVAVAENGGALHLMRNDTTGAGRSLRLDLVGTRSAKDAFGARVTVTAGGRSRTRTFRGASSYLSQSERTLTIGLATADRADTIEIAWPSGTKDVLRDVPAGGPVRVEEGSALPPPRSPAST